MSPFAISQVGSMNPTFILTQVDADCYFATASLNALPAANFGAMVAGI